MAHVVVRNVRDRLVFILVPTERFHELAVSEMADRGGDARSELRDTRQATAIDSVWEANAAQWHYVTSLSLSALNNLCEAPP